MKSILKSIIYFFRGLVFSGRNKAIALMYHSVSDNELFFAVKEEEFLKQIKYLVEKKYNIVSLEKLYSYIKNNKIPKKTVLITFDDGFQDNYLNVFPILKKYNVPAAIFISTSLVGKETKARNGDTLKMLNYKEIIEIQESDIIKFESHCDQHKKLAKLEGGEVEKELLLSKKMIKEKMNHETNFLAYPFGSFNKEVKNVAKKYYKMAFTVEKGIINSSSDLFELKRNSIDSEVTFYQFKQIIKNGRF